MKFHLTTAELSELADMQQAFRLIDVRSSEEYYTAHIPGSIHIPLSELESGVFTPNPDETIITVCGKGGGRSEAAAVLLRNSGHQQSYYLEGGTAGWSDKNQNPQSV